MRRSRRLYAGKSVSDSVDAIVQGSAPGSKASRRECAGAGAVSGEGATKGENLSVS
jgi:hypothetical protein